MIERTGEKQGWQDEAITTLSFELRRQSGFGSARSKPTTSIVTTILYPDAFAVAFYRLITRSLGRFTKRVQFDNSRGLP
jgi:hypothetical protein